MTGGLINIVSYGISDLYLTGTPQISFFKVVYRRHTNFSIESIELHFDDDTGFNTVSNITIPAIGDLIHKMYIKIDLPRINFARKVDQQEINNANMNYQDAKNGYKRFVTFMNVNADAYRAAIEVYNALNIIYSTEMVANIKAVFASYSTDPYVQDCINYFKLNTPIIYIIPSLFHLLLIADNVSVPATLSKEILKNLLDDAINYCKTIQKTYEDNLKATYAIQLDAINPNFKFAWVNKVGHAIIDYVQISIGGEKIDKHYGDWLNVWYELAGNKNLDNIYQQMIGNVKSLTDFNRNEKPAYTLYIPLQFWFNRFNGLAIPLVALQYHDVSITVKLKKFSNCSYIENMTMLNSANYKVNAELDNIFSDNRFSLNMSLYVDYVYLDKQERRRFAQSSHEYLIEQMQTMDIYNVSQSNVQTRLDFVNPCKYIIWTVQKQAYINNTSGFYKSQWDNYSQNESGFGLSMDSATLEFNGYPRIDKYTGSYYNYVQPYNYFSNTPSDGINVYSFSLRPEEQQPTGSCNFTRLTKTLFNLWINQNMFSYYENSIKKTTMVNIRFYTMNYNVLRILSGIGGLAFQ